MSNFASSLIALWRRGIQRGCITFWREREWGSAFGALAGVFILFQLLIFVLLGVQSVQHVLKTNTELRLEILAGAEDQQIQEFFAQLSVQPSVQAADYITKENAYDQMRSADPELITFLEEFEMDNPFPETIAITLTSLDQYEEFKSFIGQPQWALVVDPTFLTEATEQEVHVQELLRLTRLGSTLTAGFLILTGAVLLFITTELVRRRVLARSEEIFVEHMAGAHTFGILLPFAVEATLLLIFAVLGSLIVLVILGVALPHVLPTLGADIALESLLERMTPLFIAALPSVIIVELVSLPIIGWFGAWLGVLPKIHGGGLLTNR